jgi:hypothetical protein
VTHGNPDNRLVALEHENDIAYHWDGVSVHRVERPATRQYVEIAGRSSLCCGRVSHLSSLFFSCTTQGRTMSTFAAGASIRILRHCRWKLSPIPLLPKRTKKIAWRRLPSVNPW